MPADIHESLAGCQALLQSLRDALCVLDPEHQVVYVNQAYCENYTENGSFVTPQAAQACMSGGFYTSIRRDLDIAFSGRSAAASRWGKGSNGDPVQVSVTFMPIRNRQQQVVAVALLIIDTTHQSLDCPFDSDSGIQQTMFNSEWHWEMDEQLRFSYVSSNIALTTEHDVEWFLGKTREQLMAMSQNTESVRDMSDSNIEKSRFLDHLQDMEKRKPFSNFVYSVQYRGSQRWLSISGVPIFSQDEEERFLGYRGVGRDVTPVREAIEKHTTISRAVEKFSTGFAVFTRDGILAQCNQAMLKLLSLEPDQFGAGCTIEQMLVACYQSGQLPPLGSSLDEWVEYMSGHFKLPSTQDEWRTTDGVWLGCESEFTSDGLIIIQVSDITRQKVAERQLANESRLLRSLIDAIPDAIYVLDKEHRYICANPQVARLHGLTDSAELIGRTGLDDLGCYNVDQIIAEEKEILDTGDPVLNREFKFIDAEKTSSERTFSVTKVALRNEKEEIVGIVGHAKDVTYLHTLAEKLTWQAQHDELTGLINRRGFGQKLQAALDAVKSAGRQSVLCFVDLDQFKIVNDTVGHKAGDELLQQISALVSQRIRSSDVFARLGGDEFGLIFTDCSIAEAKDWVSDIIELISNFRFQCEDKVFDLGASVGMVALDSADQTSQSALSQADVACYTAKDLGRRRFHVFSSTDEESSRRQILLNQAADIRSALDENRFVLYAQSISHLHQGELHARHYEILVRMIGREGELIPPGAFIPAAERYELMSAVDRWVIVNTFEFLRNRDEHGRLANVAINLSGNSLNEEGMADYIKEQIRQHDIDPSRLCFELTETSIVSNISTAQVLMSELSAIGCAFALDDFGSGLSSFTYLKNFKVDYLKIDGSFVRNIVDDPTDRAMVAAINDVGHALGIKTIAEFVETPAHIEVLQKIGVDFFQGYGIDVPQPLEQLAAGKDDGNLLGTSTAA